MERKEITNKEEFNEVCQYLKNILNFAREFAKSINAKVYYSNTSHDWPTIEIYCGREFNREKNYNIDKSIFITISDYKFPPIYNVWVSVSNNYGFKEIFEIIYLFINKKRYFYKRSCWKKDIGYIYPPIDKIYLKELLKQAKQILDNFDELELEKI